VGDGIFQEEHQATNPAYPIVPTPKDMLELTGRYEYGLRCRLYEIVNDAVANNRLTGSGRTGFVYDVSEFRTRPPIMCPGKILNAATNFYSHASEGATAEQRAEAQRLRRDRTDLVFRVRSPLPMFRSAAPGWEAATREQIWHL
jgi:hypothetical protein|tara:strand:+ start:341 stop:772 length:432 start_codon:yes stop_codon:yes gene_type:complete